MMTSIGGQKYQEGLDSICKFLFQRKFTQAETATLQLLCDLLKDTNNRDRKQLIVSFLLHSFNSYYVSWLRKHNYDVAKETEDLQSLEHDNLLIAYCSNVYAMEMLLKQAFDFYCTPQEPLEVMYCVENYKMVYLM